MKQAELESLECWRAGFPALPFGGTKAEDADWLRLGFAIALDAGRTVRAARLAGFDGSTSRKADGSPVTRLEHEIEAAAEERLAGWPERVTLVGEETGGSVSSRGVSLALDPVDGTWSLLNRTETVATTLAFLRDGEPFLGLVSNPATCELAYAFAGGATRLLQLSALGEADAAASLPLQPAAPKPLLVHLHPNRTAGPLASHLLERWSSGDLQMIRMPGGSPALGLLEAAKGAFAYVNLWPRREAAAWDLAAALLLVRGAGGEVVDSEGRVVQAIGHRGPLVAAIDATSRATVRAWVAASVSS